MMQHRKKAAAQQWLGDGGGDAICRNFPLAPLIICRPLHKADKFHTKSYLVEMSSSWIFSARASPSYEVAEPRRAGALQFPNWNQADSNMYVKK